MKYIILETPTGAKLPILFPDALTHCHVAGAMQMVLDTLDPKKDLRPRQLDALRLRDDAAPVVSAGFVAVGNKVVTYGESESLGGIKSQPLDGARIVLGDSAAYMPDEAIASVAKLLSDAPSVDDMLASD